MAKMRIPKSLMGIVGLVAAVVALGAPLVALAGFSSALLPVVLVVHGIVLGFGLKKLDVKLGIAILIFLAGLGYIAIIPVAGEVVSEMAKNVGLVVGSMAFVPAAKVMLRKLGVPV